MAITNPLSSLPEEASQSFPGQQDGERILYMIRPHWSREVSAYLKILILAGLAVTLVWYLPTFGFSELDESSHIRLMLGIGLLAALFALYVRQRCEQSRAYLTDRRVIRFEGAMPRWQSQRGLFWTDVVKIRTESPNLVLRFLNVGSLEIIPNFAVEGQNVLITHVYMCGDLGSYIEKLIFTFRARPAELADMRPFIPRPKGQRY
jgi:hypothetical protein